MQRESACPVHFLWDGRGAGRWAVRLGFLGFLVAGSFVTGALMFHLEPLRTAGGFVGAASAAAWLLGQALTRLARRPASLSA